MVVEKEQEGEMRPCIEVEEKELGEIGRLIEKGGLMIT